ncbi:DUF1737 domain-containing protein [Flavobacterium sp. AG291]|uniref:DUF1737 domain-containing protein n=1 Tax=Flavobacterium sp. AG291 TaxID=2184000 RepID=UPI000E0BC002|nr:DUF1737 domain-containing protein [Flavobacterium sp. AG291]RDI06688.1 uncharacterized protein DUF1737 [Flavobacterium sp. AG291]
MDINIKTMKYKVVRDCNLDDFEKEINKLLQKGWQLYGGIKIKQGLLHQALVLLSTK